MGSEMCIRDSVKPDSLTDIEARSRSTTVYLADRRHDMLPAILSADLCSLLSNVDRYVCMYGTVHITYRSHCFRYAVSVIWQLDSVYHVKDVWYGRTVIRSSYKLAYEVSQKTIQHQPSTA